MLKDGSPLVKNSDYFVDSNNNIVLFGESNAVFEITSLGAPNAPENLQATGGNAQITLTWSAPASNGGSSVTAYKVYRGTASGGETLLTTLGNVLTYTNTGLANGQIYYYKVSAVNSVGEGPLSNEASATPATVPTSPTISSATPGNAQLTLSWTAPSNNGGSAITGYKVYRGITAGSETLLTTLGNVLTYTDTSVTNGQTYYYKISAVNGVGEGSLSDEASATPATVPSTPQNLVATGGNAQVTLSWSAPTSNGGSVITGYKIYRGMISGGETLFTTIGNVVTYTNTGLTNGLTYYYKVSAVNGAGEGPQSSEASAKPATVPTAPTLTSAAPGNAQVVLAWSVPASNGGSSITGYKIYRGTTSGGETLLTTVANVLTYTDTSLTNGQTYYYKVSAVNSVGEGTLSNELSATPATVPTTPSLSSATSGNSQVVLTWTAPSSNGGAVITGYKVYRGTTSGGETLLTMIGNVLTYTDNAVSNGVTYYYKVSAVNSVGEGPQSNEASATPATVPGAPTLNSVTPGNAQVVLTWTAPSNSGGSTLTGYRVYRGTTSGGETLLTTLGNVLTYTDAWVTNGQIYFYKVSAVNSVGEGAQSNEASATPATVPSVPQNLQATAWNAFVNLTWEAPSSNGGSIITNYKIWRGTSSGTETFFADAGSKLWYNDTGLANGQTYFYEVRAENAQGAGPSSSEVSATPTQATTVPSAPQNLIATAGNAQVVLTWSTPSNNGGIAITNYKIYRGTTTNGENLLTAIGNVLTYTDLGLTNGQTYYYKVSAVNSNGEGAQSNEASTTPATNPTAPSISSATPGNSQITLVWTAPSSNGSSAITNYKVYRGTTSGGETLLTTVGNVLTYTDNSLTNGQAYYYKVSAVNAVGEGSLSDEASAIPATVPSAPQSLAANPGNAQVTLSWSPPATDGGSPITAYKIYRGTTSGGESLLTTVGNILTYTDTSTINGQLYFFNVSAVNSIGEGAQSNEVTATPTISATVPSAPQSLIATAGNAQVTLTWSAPSNNGGSAITGYNIYRGTTSGGETLLATLDNVLTYTNTSLTNGQTYYYKVSAVNSVGEGPLSNEASAVPNPVVTVTNPISTSVLVAGSKFTVSWTSAGTIPGLSVQLLKGGSSILTLAQNTPNDGNQQFTLPFSLASGNDYAIRITSTNNAAVTDDSDTFTIRAPSLSIIYPNGGETIVAGASVNIRWTGDMSLLGKVSITLWQNGQQVSMLSSGTANDGSFIWSPSLTLAPGTGYSIRITPVSHPEFYDNSDSSFSVRKPILAITSPLAGTSFARSSTMAIKWQKDTANVGTIKIELYSNGVLIRVIASSTTNNGAYSWKIPTTTAVGAYQIKISSNNDPTIFAWSGVFNIK